MKYFLSLILLLLIFQNLSANTYQRYRIHLVTWDGIRVSGKFDAITDSSISLKTSKGSIYTFSAVQTKHLQIWRPGINLPATVAGATVLTFIFVNSVPKQDGLGRIAAYITGVPLGSLLGLIIGDRISTAVNNRRMHVTDFKQVRSRL